MSDSIENRLRELQTLLQDVKAVLVLANRQKLEEAKNHLLPSNSMKAKIYDLCDGSRSTREIAQLVNKDEAYVRANISVLRRDGLVRTIEKGEGQFHEQIF